MPETNDIKTRLHEVGVALKHLFKPKKAVNQETVEKELAEFAKIKGYDLDNPNFDIEEFQEEFVKFLRDKDYDFAGVDASLISPNSSEPKVNVLQALENVHKVSEELNELTPELTVFVDTRKMMPGLVCYVIEKVAPTLKEPYVTYRPVPRVIAQIHDSGVNGGTIFFTYNHKISTSQNFNGVTSVVSEDEVIYSPLTKEHADYICKLLNIQSKQVYAKYLEEKSKQEQLKLQAEKQKLIQHVK